MINRDALIEVLTADPNVAVGAVIELAERILALDGERPKRTSRPILELSKRDLVRLPRLFAEKTAEEDGCLVWTGSRTRGYGLIQVYEGTLPRMTMTHRAAYLLAKGPITDPTLVVDHLCRNRACLRIEHLELVTAKENVNRGKATKTICLRGHALTGANVRLQVNKRTGYTNKVCLACRDARKAEQKAAKASVVA